MKPLLRLGLVAGLFLYLILWKWTYINFISPKFGYLDYVYKLPPDIFELMAWGSCTTSRLLDAYSDQTTVTSDLLDTIRDGHFTISHYFSALG